MRVLDRMNVSWRLMIFTLVALAGILIIIMEAVSSADEVLMEDRELKTRHVVEVAYGVLTHYHALETQGTLTRDEAQKQALTIVRTLRYDDKEYFWINDAAPRMIMHPIKKELDGQDLSGLKDANGKLLFVEFAEMVRKSGAGFVEYMWPKPGSQTPVGKISYVKGFAPWGWIIGSGIYVDDVSHLFWKHALHSILLAGLLAVVLLLAAWLVARSILGQLGGEPAYAVELAGRIADGDLSSEVKVRRNDRGSVISAMGVMQANLKQMIRQVHESSQEITDSAQQLAEASGQVSSASRQQCAAAASTAAAVEEIGVSIEHVTDTAHQTEANSHHTSELADQGERLAQEASAGISNISHTVERTSGQIQSLRERSDEIGGIAGVIREIAEQTNLLALNAAIEAARAGEQGRGFSVVADEVRKLAERTAQATAQIAQVIGRVQEETQAAVVSIQAIGPEVETGARLSGEASQSLRAISGGAQDTLQKVRQVAGAMEELTQASNNIGRDVQQIAAMAERNEQAVQGAVASSQRLGDLAEKLNETVSRFRF